MTIRLRHAQAEIFQDRTRFRMLMAGRRFGKTHLALAELTRGVSETPGGLFYYTAPTYRMAKDIAWKSLKTVFPVKWVKKRNESELKVYAVNGAEIHLKGTDSADSLRGPSLSGAVLDEAAYMQAGVWEEVIRPALADQMGWALFTTTPSWMSAWYIELWEKANTAEEESWKTWVRTTLDGENVMPEEVEEARRSMDPRTFRQEFLASLEKLTGVVAVSFDDENISEDAEDDPNLPLHIGLDFNVDPFCAACGVIKQVEIKDDDGVWTVVDRLHCFDEIVLKGGATTHDFVEEVYERFNLKERHRKVNVYPDPTGSARHTSSSGASDHGILRQAGFKVHLPTKSRYWKQKDKITCVNTSFLDASNRRSAFIHPRCKYGIRSLRNLIYKEGTSIPDKSSGFDHWFDAYGYLVLSAFNLVKPVSIGGTPLQLYGPG